jgi:hypothetical protein
MVPGFFEVLSLSGESLGLLRSELPTNAGTVSPRVEAKKARKRMTCFADSILLRVGVKGFKNMESNERGWYKWSRLHGSSCNGKHQGFIEYLGCHDSGCTDSVFIAQHHSNSQQIGVHVGGRYDLSRLIRKHYIGRRRCSRDQMLLPPLSAAIQRAV